MESHYRFLKLGLGARLVVAGSLFAVAAILQIPTNNLATGVPFIVAAWFFLALKPVSNKPKDQGLEEWRAVTDGEIARIADSLKQTKKLRVNLAGPAVLKVMLLIIAVLIAGGSAVASPRISVALFNLCLFSVPGLFFGSLKAHLPPELDMKMSGFLAVLNVTRPEGYILTPYLRFDKDAEGRDVPEDMRLMLEPRRKPDDLVGIQFQSSINNGEHGKVPYMYAVVLTKGKNGPSHQKFKTMSARGFEVEPGGDADYGTVVVRQETGGGGYHTTDDDCESLMVLMIKALGKVTG
jgi:hypothetical protein